MDGLGLEDGEEGGEVVQCRVIVGTDYVWGWGGCCGGGGIDGVVLAAWRFGDVVRCRHCCVC